MEKRIAYAKFEETIINLYEREWLTLNLLDSLAAQYRLVGPDSAGSQHVVAKDGRDLQQICLALVDPTFPLVERGSDGDDELWEQELKKWEEMVRERWDWRTSCTAFSIQDQQDSAA